MKTNYNLVMPFWIDTAGYTDRDREMFVCGVEFQMVYEQLKAGGSFSRTIHRENSSRVRMMAAKMKRDVSVSLAAENGIEYDGWAFMEAKP